MSSRRRHRQSVMKEAKQIRKHEYGHVMILSAGIHTNTHTHSCTQPPVCDSEMHLRWQATSCQGCTSRGLGTGGVSQAEVSTSLHLFNKSPHAKHRTNTSTASHDACHAVPDQHRRGRSPARLGGRPLEQLVLMENTRPPRQRPAGRPCRRETEEDADSPKTPRLQDGEEQSVHQRSNFQTTPIKQRSS